MRKHQNEDNILHYVIDTGGELFHGSAVVSSDADLRSAKTFDLPDLCLAGPESTNLSTTLVQTQATAAESPADRL